MVNAVALALLWRNGWWLYQSDGGLWAHDYVAQWAAGHRVLSGNAARVYDWADQIAYQTRLIGASKPVELYVFYPPHFLFTTPLFAWLDYLPASLAFLIMTTAAYAASLNLLVRDWVKAMLVAVSGGGAFYSIWWIQNGFLTAALLTAGLALLKNRPVLAGVFFGMLTIKPQLGLLIPMALLCSRNWRALASASGTFLLLAVAAELVLGAGIWARFFASIRATSEFLAGGNLWFKQQSVFAFAFPFVGPIFAWVVYVVLATVIAVIVASMWSRPGADLARSSALVSGSLLVTPYVYTYDAVSLTAAAVMLLKGDGGRGPGPRDRILIFAACLMPMASRFAYSGAVPLAALVMLYVAVSQHGARKRAQLADVPPL
jgi:hypothetical protein